MTVMSRQQEQPNQQLDATRIETAIADYWRQLDNGWQAVFIASIIVLASLAGVEVPW